MGQYQQATGTRVDLLMNDAYVQATGTQLTLELVEAIRKQLTETITVNDFFDRTSNLFRTYTDSFIPSDGTSRNGLNDDFEDGDYTSNPSWNEAILDGAATISSSISKSGSNSVKLTVPGTADSAVLAHERLENDQFLTDDVWDAWMRIEDVNNGFFGPQRNSGSFTSRDGIKFGFEDSGSFVIETSDTNGNTIEKRTFGSYSPSSWYRFELTVDLRDNTLDAKVFDDTDSKINEELNVPFSGRDNMQYSQFGISNSSSSSTMYVDLATYDQELVGGVDKKVFKELDEQITASDDVFFEVAKSLNESMALADTETDQADLFRDFNESVTVADQLVRSFNKSFDEQFLLLDSDVRQIDKPLQEVMNMNDTFNREADYFRNYTDTVRLNDFVDLVKILFLTVQDSFVLNDEDSKTVGKQVDDSFSLSDQYDRNADYFRDYFGTFQINTQDPEFVGLFEFTETVRLNDQFSRQMEFFRDFDDSFTLNDQVTRLFDKNLDETMLLDGPDSLKFRIFKNLTETARLVDEASFALFRRLQDSFTVNDEVDTSTDLFRDFADSFTLSDQYNRTVEYFRNYTDTLRLLDTFNKAAKYRVQYTETLRLLDEFKYRFFEGPGLAPYFANILVQLAGSANIQNKQNNANIDVESAGSGDISYGDQPQR